MLGWIKHPCAWVNLSKPSEAFVAADDNVFQFFLWDPGSMLLSPKNMFYVLQHIVTHSQIQCLFSPRPIVLVCFQFPGLA